MQHELPFDWMKYHLPFDWMRYHLSFDWMRYWLIFDWMRYHLLIHRINSAFFSLDEVPAAVSVNEVLADF